MRNGEIFHAETQYQGGIEALQTVLAWDSDHFEIVALPRNVPITIQEPFPALMLHTMQTIDDQMRNALAYITGLNNQTIEQFLRNLDFPEKDRPDPIPSSGQENTHKEEKIMVTQARIEEVLDSLRNVEGSFGGVLVADDGMIIASRLDKRFAADKVAALASDLVTALKRVITELQFGEPKTMLIEGELGKVTVIEAPGGGMFILLIGSTDMNLGMARMALHEAMAQLT